MRFLSGHHVALCVYVIHIRQYFFSSFAMANADCYRGNDAWNSVYMPPKQFLLQHNGRNEPCFCNICRVRKYEEVSQLGATRGNEWLQERCLVHLPLGRERKAEELFQMTLKQILYAQVYKEACLANTTYVYWKCWAKTQPQFAHLVNGNDRSKKTFDDLAKEISEASSVFMNWDLIVLLCKEYRLVFRTQ